ncbi:hypothetical protein [Streptomyces sp. cg36]|uniref:hypothetical protein n=1 Tax=Streptomyces sp. cg36 TaxID=3238798 RepID=UPI0034E1EAC4
MGRRHTRKKGPLFAMPEGIVLLGTPDGWRHSIRTTAGGMVCGQLSQVPAGAEAETAQAAATTMLQELARDLYGASIEVTWEPAHSGDSLTGSVRATGATTGN